MVPVPIFILIRVDFPSAKTLPHLVYEVLQLLAQNF